MFSQIFSMLSNLIHLILGIDSPQHYPPPLSTEAERESFLEMEKGDRSARERLILHNLRLVSNNAAANDGVAVVNDNRLTGSDGALWGIKFHVQGVLSCLRDCGRGGGVLITDLGCGADREVQ